MTNETRNREGFIEKMLASPVGAGLALGSAVSLVGAGVEYAAKGVINEFVDNVSRVPLVMPAISACLSGLLTFVAMTEPSGRDVYGNYELNDTTKTFLASTIIQTGIFGGLCYLAKQMQG
ncbi:hypothetical protein A2647_05295 [Candidatus Nomurabacteria bacterium RIFCSPHIGHO2_01_FULL_40_24b]|uniref:Uncharacterized protein n=1 Tax=Candidatus Nomurabacteria bacterium RIFCSPHIGHO2_01_FULL_40_24b TaxID=1801739 RepID=A0A1F6V771_9BACT|nr:MAG: hypothetical protein A2647_05295 [Candidatus Nomurabacteria bacterium RIFCSPHIGHO2_01_FULL_40_24b]